MQINNLLPQWLIDKGVNKMLAFDYETFYSVHYTLKKMSTSLYIFDEQFKVHGVGVAYNNQPTKYLYDLIAIEEFFEDVDWEHTAILAHHTNFDALILTRYYGYTPAFYLDTLSMARPILMNTIKSMSIDSIAKHLDIGSKIEGLDSTKGKRDLTEQEQRELGDYCINDVEIMIGVFILLLPHLPQFEMEIIDWHIRMYVEGEFIIDNELADQEIINIQHRKKKTFETIRKYFQPKLRDSDLDTLTILRSGEKFASILKHNNIVPPLKTSPATNKQVYAFAKNHVAFMDFANQGPIPKLMFEARVESKSDTTLNKAKLLRKFGDHPPFPLYLNYWRATTGRTAGCVTPDHEILTEQGWIPIDTWTKEKIMTWDPATKQAQFEQPHCMNSYVFNGKLNTHTSRYLTFTVTDEHKIPIDNKWYDRIDQRLAIELYNTNAASFLSCTHTGKQQINKTKLKLAIAFQADGHFSKKRLASGEYRTTGIRFEFNKARKINRLTKLLNLAFIKYTTNVTKRNTTRIYIPKSELIQLTYMTKTLPWSWLQLTPELHKVLLNEILLWDGHTNHKNRWRYITTNKANAELIATIAHLNEYRAFIRKPPKQKTNYKQQYIVSFTPNKINAYIKAKCWSKTNYKGLVYCPTVSTGHFLIRKNLKISITCNSDKIQAQNFTRGSNTRKCLTAPKDHLVLSVDSSGIELRVAIWFAEQLDKIAMVNNKEDLYVDMATSIYHKPTASIDKYMRGIGKVAILSNMYGSGIPTFDNMLKSGSMAPPIHLPYEEVMHIHSTFRKEYNNIVCMWDKCQRFLFAMVHDNIHKEADYKGLHFEDNKVWTQHGMYLNYHDLRVDKQGNFSYQGAFGIRKKIYGSLFFNNLCQHMARNIVYYQINLVKKHYKPIHAVHDETSIIIPEKEFDEAKAFLLECFRTAPDYLTGIELNAEVEWGKNAKGISYYAK